MKKAIFLALVFALSITAGFSQTFTGKPIYQIVTKRGGNYLGTTTVELFPAIAPLAVRNFDSLVGVHFYDSTAFHRVIPGFMIQGGDPNSRSGPRSTWGMGDPNQPNVNAEFSAARHLRGTLSAARDTGINSANSQFFICVAPASWLNGQYTVYGRVTSGMDIVDTIVSEPRDSVDNPLVKIEMFVTYLGSNDSVPQAPNLTQPLDNSFGAASNRLLKWDALSDGIIYHVDVSTDSTFATTYRSVDVGTNLYSLTGLVAGSRYYWRVNTNNGGHVGGYSQRWSFLISGTGIESYETDNKITVSPNPGNGQFLFSNLDGGNTIEIFDITGRSVLKTSTGNNSCQIDLSGKSEGLYFYCITSQNRKIKQGKIILE